MLKCCYNIKRFRTEYFYVILIRKDKLRLKMANEGAEDSIIRVDFEVHGRVQGVFFRKFTQEEGTKLGIRGFCRNTSSGTVSGSMEGPRAAIDKMKYWLQHTGSPMSRISNVDFTNEKVLNEYSIEPGFDIKRTV